MNRIVWICIFLAISTLPVLTLSKIIILQNNYTSYTQEKKYQYSERGPIYDRNGNILAMQINSWNVGLRLIDTDNPDEVIRILSKVLDIPVDTITQILEPPTKYARVKKFINKQEYQALLSYKEQGKLKGVQINEVPWRRYPGNDSIAHVIGFFGEENRGLDGIEAKFDDTLSPHANGIGNAIYLTIDSVLQKSIEQIVKETLYESKSSYITTILMDARSGDILAYVEEPSYDLNKYYTYPQSQLSNKIISDLYEPGSVFKVFSIASMLDADVIDMHSTFDASAPYVDSRYNFVIQDIYYPGIISTAEIIKYSSNVGISHAVYNMDNTLFYKYLTEFGFGRKTGITLPGESKGILHDTTQWSARSKPTIALGQEIAVTAIQIISAATAIANDGILLAPNLIHKIVDSKGKIVHRSTPTQVRQVISKNTADNILSMMYLATTVGGTAHRIKLDNIHISAKTGTAQVFDVEKNEYSSSKFIASTLGIVPTEDPQLIIYAVIHMPTSGEIYGGRTTAPMIRKMLKFILPYLGYTGEHITNTTVAMKDDLENNIQQYTHTNGVYHDYTGLSKREILRLFTHVTFQVKINGNGNVVKQHPAPGTAITTHPILTLYFN